MVWSRKVWKDREHSDTGFQDSPEPLLEVVFGSFVDNNHRSFLRIWGGTGKGALEGVRESLEYSDEGHPALKSRLTNKVPVTSPLFLFFTSKFSLPPLYLENNKKVISLSDLLPKTRQIRLFYLLLFLILFWGF